MERVTLREVFGVEDRAFNWGQVAMLFNAFLFSLLFFRYVLFFPIVDWSFYFFGTVAELLWEADLLSFLVLALLLFRFIRSIIVVLVLSAVIHAPYIPASIHLFFGDASHTMSEAIGLPSYLTLQALNWIVLLGVLGLALRLIKRPGVALVAGAILGGLASWAMWVFIVPFLWTHPEAGPPYFSWSNLVGNLARYASLGLLLWLGLHLTRKPPTTPGFVHLSRSRFLMALTATGGLGIYLSPILIGNFFEQLQSGDVNPVGLVLVVAGLLLGIGGAVVWWVFVYKMWANIPESHARMTPGKAVGFSFIPAFNLYWIFPVFRGFSKDFNRLIARDSLAIKPLPVALFTAFPILLISSAVFLSLPAVYLPLWWAWYFGLLAIMAKTCDAINALPETGEIIEGPLETRPRRVHFITCSDCGAEVSSEDTKCPSCGAIFDED